MKSNNEFSTLVACLQIGNSDGKLSQKEWAHYVASMTNVVRSFGHEVHFTGFSPGDSIYQNACFVLEILLTKVGEFIKEVERVRKTYKQDSAAVLLGSALLV